MNSPVYEPFVGPTDKVKNIIAALSGTADGVFATDDHLRICYWNDAAVQLLNYPAAEVLGRPCYDVIQGCTEAGIPQCHPNCQIRALLLQKRLPSNCDLLCRRKDGCYRWFNFSTICLNLAGADQVIVHFFRTIHRCKQIEQAARYFMSVLDQAEAEPPTPR